MQQKITSRIVSSITAIAIAWFVITGLLVVIFWSNLPKTNIRWVLFIVIGPPVYVVAEGIFGWVFSDKHGKAISAKNFSWLRIVIVLAVTVVYIVIFSFVQSFLKL